LSAGLRAVAVNQVSQRERSLAGLRLRFVYVTAPVALRDAEDAAPNIYVAPLQPQDFGDPGAGGDCGFKHEQVGIAQPRQRPYGFLFRQNPFLAGRGR
jgi:hypothetical protein